MASNMCVCMYYAKLSNIKLLQWKSPSLIKKEIILYFLSFIIGRYLYEWYPILNILYTKIKKKIIIKNAIYYMSYSGYSGSIDYKYIISKCIFGYQIYSQKYTKISRKLKLILGKNITMYQI